MEKLLPQNIEAEQGVLGSIILDPEAIDLVADFLAVEDFYRDAHRTIYEAIVHLYAQHEPADYITLCDELERHSKLEESGGASYITLLVNCVPTSGNVEYYGRIVYRTAILRRLIHGAGQIAAAAYEDADAEVALEKAESLIYAIGRRDQAQEPVSASKVYDEFSDWFERIPEGGAIVGVPTGLEVLDRNTSGLQKSDLIVVAGRPGSGKTSFALSIGLTAARKYERGVLFFSAEMSRLQLYQRAVAHEARVNLHRLRTGQLNHAEHTRVSDEAVNLSELPLYIDHTPAISIGAMRSKIRRELRKHDIDLIIVDYLGKCTALDADGKRYQDTYKEVSEIASGLKNLAREFNLPVLALAQLSRKVEERADKRPQLSDLRDSGAIEQEADIVAFLYRDDYYHKDSDRKGTVDILIAKHRNGLVEDITVGFEASQTRFYNLDEPRALVESTVSSSEEDEWQQR